MTDEKPQISFFDKISAHAQEGFKFLKTAADKLQHIARSNIEMGIYQMRIGEFKDAVLRFKIALLFEKNNQIAHYLLGKAYVFAGKRAKAVAPLKRALELDPNLNEAKFLLSICGQSTDFNALPRSFIIERNDTLATNYDKIYPEGLQTNLIKKLAEEFDKYFENWQGFNVLDLGCNGGEIGHLLKSKANIMVGVEPSIKMAALARAKRVDDILVYNKIVAKFPEDYLAESDEKFQIILAMHYLSNFGALDKFFKQVRAKYNETGGVLIFAITPTTAADYVFGTTKIFFEHSEKYVEKCLTDAGFNLHKKTEIVYESGVTDLIYIAEAN